MQDLPLLLRWLMALEVIGWGLYPLLYLAVPGLRDRGLTLAKPFALLALVYPVWFVAALGKPAFTAPALVAVGAVLAVGGWVGVMRRPGLPHDSNETPLPPAACALLPFLRTSWRYVLLSEAVFVGGFLFYAWLRSYNPEILGTEKPMEIGFLSAATRGETLPPRDPWLSGHGINYYYFGYVLVAALAKLTAISSSVAFNLGLATIFAMALTGGAGVTANLLAAARERDEALPRARMLALGLLGGYLLVFAGNMYAARDVLSKGQAAIDEWWWGGLGWKSSRVVVDSGFPVRIFGPNFGPIDTITEFPFFSFVLGDLHAHVLALPFAVLALGLALDSFLRPLLPDDGSEASGVWAYLPPPGALARIGVAALVVGGLYALNSWDLPTYAVVYLAAGALPIVIARRAVRRREWAAAAIFAAGCFVLWLPFHLGFTSLIGGEPFDLPEPWASVPLIPTLSKTLGLVIWGKTPLDQFFTVYLLPWIAGLLFLVWRWRAARAATQHGGLTTPILALLGLALVALLLQMPLALSAGLIVLLVVTVARQWRQLQLGLHPDLFAMGLFAAAFALVLLTEVFFIHDVFSNRMNTIFKVYYQAWTLLAVATGYAVIQMVAVRVADRREVWRLPATAALVLLLVATMAYPVYGSNARTEEFIKASGLDGLAFVRNAEPQEYAGIVWAREQIPAGSVVAEAPGCSYGEYFGLPHDRVSAFAGVSTPLGWGGHESQWRGGDPELLRELGPRTGDINRLFATTDEAETRTIMDRYSIDYVYIGVFEREGYKAGGIGSDCKAGGGYPPEGLAKFDTMMERVFASDGGLVAIYRRK
jgi:YYY domain-containing protein